MIGTILDCGIEIALLSSPQKRRYTLDPTWKATPRDFSINIWPGALFVHY